MSDTQRAGTGVSVAAAAIVGGTALGALLAARAWRRRSAYDFADKVVVITGGSRGLGLVLARQLARERASDAELVITTAARLAILARSAAPELFADAMALVHRMLPGPTSVEGDRPQRGRDSESPWASPSTVLTAPTYRAARANNELSLSASRRSRSAA